MIFKDPNKYARSAELEMHEYTAVFHGYQEYALTRNNINILLEDHYLQRKQEILSPYFTPKYLKQRTILDVGANSGFFCFWALQSGANKATALDIDNKYLGMIDDAKRKFQIENLNTVNANLMEWNQPADIVFAFAFAHWAYSCTATFGSLDAIVEKLSQLTTYALFIEWISPNDPAIEFFHHLDWNKDIIREPYTLEMFELALSRHFQRYECIGNTTVTRRIYVGFRTSQEIDLSCPLPIILPDAKIVYSRLLIKYNGMDYWSRVYESGNKIYKQTSFDLAEREAYFLSLLNSNYFPKEYGCQKGDNYSLVILENIHGQSILNTGASFTSSRQQFLQFIRHCLKILKNLKQKGIVHRDIRPENILIRNGKPVLIDFGWAASEKKPCITPTGLGASQRPLDGSFCNIYSMGKVLKDINQNKYPKFDYVFDLMIEPDPLLRITDVEVLDFLFALVAEATDTKKSEAHETK